MQNNDEEVPVRSPIDIGVADPVSTQDEQDFSTLRYIQKQLNSEMQRLTDVDVLDLTEGELSVKEQVAAYRKARGILEPIQALVNSTINDIKLKQKEGR